MIDTTRHDVLEGRCLQQTTRRRFLARTTAYRHAVDQPGRRRPAYRHAVEDHCLVQARHDTTRHAVDSIPEVPEELESGDGSGASIKRTHWAMSSLAQPYFC